MKMKWFGIVCAFLLMPLAGQAVMENKSHLSNEQSAVKNKDGYKEIHTKEVEEFIKAHPSLIIIDVQSSKYDEGHRIHGARYTPAESTDDEIRATIPSQEALILVYCASGECPLSKYMSERLVKLDYKNVTRYVEGLEGWEGAYHPTDKATPKKKFVDSKSQESHKDQHEKSNSSDTDHKH